MSAEHPFLQGGPLVIAHRGAHTESIPENTLPAFERAQTLGVDGVELDVRLSADGVPVVIHDATVDRTTGGSGPVAAKTAGELRQLKSGEAHIPTLAEVFATLGDGFLINVELKGRGAALARAVAVLIREHDAQRRVLVSSFNPLLLRVMASQRVGVPLGYLYPPQTRIAPLLARPLSPYEALHPHHSVVTERLARRGLPLNVWTVNEAPHIERMRAVGVNAIITDTPEQAREIINRG